MNRFERVPFFHRYYVVKFNIKQKKSTTEQFIMIKTAYNNGFCVKPECLNNTKPLQIAIKMSKLRDWLKIHRWWFWVLIRITYKFLHRNLSESAIVQDHNHEPSYKSLVKKFWQKRHLQHIQSHWPLSDFVPF